MAASFKCLEERVEEAEGAIERRLRHERIHQGPLRRPEVPVVRLAHAFEGLAPFGDQGMLPLSSNLRGRRRCRGIFGWFGNRGRGPSRFGAARPLEEISGARIGQRRAVEALGRLPALAQ